MILRREKEWIVEHGRKLITAGLTSGTGGNLSVLGGDGKQILITPTGVPYSEMTPDDVVVMDRDGRITEGGRKPSSEWGFHVALYRTRSDVRAVVHTHSVYATTLACLHWEIPAVHYLVGFAGRKVPLAPYATYGTEDLARHVTETIGSSNAVLLANHGLVAVGPDLAHAFNTAEEIEFVARLYYLARCAGEPQLLPDDEMDRVIEKFKDYGPKASSDNDAS